MLLLLGWEGIAAGLNWNQPAGARTAGAGCLKVWELLLGESGTSAVVDAGTCYLAMLVQILLVCAACGWLLHRRLMVSAKKLS